MRSASIESSPLSPAPPPAVPLSSVMSAPAQNPRPAPVITIPTTSRSRSARLAASASSAPIVGVHAFSASGRFNVIVATGSDTSYRICSYDITPL